MTLQEDDLEATRRRLSNAMRIGTVENPDALAADRRQATGLGVSVGALRLARQQGVTLPSADNDLTDLPRTAPRTTDFLSVPANAAVAHDSVRELSDMERIIAGGSFAGQSVSAVAPRTGSAWNILRGLGGSLRDAFSPGGTVFEGAQLAEGDFLSMTGLNAPDAAGGRMFNAATRQSQMQDFRRAQASVDATTPQIDNVIGRNLYGAGNSLIRSAPGFVLGLPGVLALAGTQTSTTAYGKYAERGATPAQAALGAGIEGGTEVLTELIPMGTLVDSFGKQGLKAWLGRYVFQDLIGEELATAVQDATDTAIANPDKTWGDYLRERPSAVLDTALQTLFQGGLVAAPSAAANALARREQARRARAQAGEADTATLEGVLAMAENSVLRERDPGTFEQFIAAAAEDGPVENLYVDAQAFAQAVNDAGLDINEIAANVPAVGEQLQAALTNGGDITIPVEQFAARIAGTDASAALLDHMRVNPSLPSRAETAAVSAQDAATMQAEAERILVAEETNTEFKASADRVRENFVGQLTAAGRFTKDVNTAYAGLVSNFYTVQAARLGITPEEMAAKYPLRIASEAPASTPTQSTMDQPDEFVDLVHFSDTSGMTIADPTKWGASSATSNSERGRRNAGAPGRTYFGVPGVYSGENAVGIGRRDFQYSARVPRAKLYDFDADPQGLRGSLDATGYEQAIQAAGFLGYRSDATVPGAVALFDAVPLQAQGPLRTDEQARQVRSRTQELSAIWSKKIVAGDAPASAKRPDFRAVAIAELETVAEYAQSASLRDGRETLTKYGLDPAKKHSTRAVAAALEARQRAKYGTISRTDRSDAAAKRIAGWMAEEVQFEMETPGSSGVGWYSTKFQAALDIFAQEFPELKSDPGARDLMTALIAITSDGQKVVPNFQQAAGIYRNFKRDGKFVASQGTMRQDSVDGNLAKIQELHDTLGLEGMRAVLLEEMTVSELKKKAATLGVQFSSSYQASVRLPMAGLIFGPKLGAFYANLMGAEGYLTMDRWWSRTFNRYRGTLIQSPTKEGIARFRELIGEPDFSDDQVLAATVEPRNAYAARGFKGGTEIEKAANTIYKAAFEGIEDQPFNASDRTFMLKVVAEARKSLSRRGVKISVADIQAVLWYYEKRLYGELGARQTADISYEEAAQRVVAESRGSGPGGPGLPDAAAFEGFDPGPTTFAQRAVAASSGDTPQPSAVNLDPVAGAPGPVKVNGERIQFGPHAPAREAAYRYMVDRGVQYAPPTQYATVDTERAGRIAEAFDQMAHAPNDPQVRASYRAMIDETLAQYQAIKATGLEIEFIDFAATGDPYAATPRMAIMDVTQNNHLWVFPTDDGFGSDVTVDISGNPLLELTDEFIGDRQLRANDVFRIVHDYFGHIKDGFGFRADGEENAWQSHASMYSPLARKAMTTETRGQNSWVNYGPHAAHNKTASGSDTIYAPQKIGLLPDWVSEEGFLGGADSGTVAGERPQATYAQVQPPFYSALAKAVEQTQTKRASAEQWKATLAKTPGVKKDEIEWSGVNDWLDGQVGAVDREALSTYLAQGGVQIDEVVLGGTDEAAVSLDDNDGWEVVPTADGSRFSIFYNGEERDRGWASEAAAREAMDKHRRWMATVPTEFSSYKLPGADDTYREVLLTLPAIQGPSTHWATDNVVAHARLTTRTDANGARVLFIEEVQSDWHQKGRDFGYETDANLDEEARVRELLLRASEEAEAGSEAIYAAVVEAGATLDPATRLTEAKLNDLISQAENAQLRLREAQLAYDAAQSGGIPDAPFRTSWSTLVMKRMIRYAVDTGHDKIAWINGNQQNGGQTGGDGSFFYERNLVNTTNDLLKKLGGRVEQIDFRPEDPLAQVPFGVASREASSPYLDMAAERIARAEARGDMESAQIIREEAEAERVRMQRPATALGVQNGFIINDQMRAVAAGGFPLFQQNRGQITFGEDITQTPSVISLLRTADLSTFMHELGHFFLEVQTHVASQADAPADLVADLDTTLQWFRPGLTRDQWNAMPLEEKRQYHEQFARGFEAFLFEGKAPTTELRGVFQKFRSWLLNVYKTISNLNVELTDEVRNVMGRMLASAEAIKETEDARGFAPLFESKPEGMSDAAWAEYERGFAASTEDGLDQLTTRTARDMQWLSNAKSKTIKQLQAQANEQRKVVKAEVTAEVRAEPVNRARQFLSRGTDAEGNPVEGAGKLDLATLRAMYGTESTALWRGLKIGGKYGEAGESGLDPDVVAEQFGFESGDALVRALIQSEDQNAKIAGLTDQRMLERFGDVIDEPSLERAANEAVANSARARFVATEMAILAKLTGQPRALAAVAREAAANIVNRLELKRLKPAQFLAAQTRASKAADKALRADDTVEAAKQKRFQLINLQAARYAMDAQKDVDKALALFKRIVTANDDALARSRDMNLVNAARAILATYGVGRTKNDPAGYLKLLKNYDPTLYADLVPLIENAAGSGKDITQLTYEEFQGLRDAVNQLWNLSRRTKQIEIDGKLMAVEDARAALMARLDEVGIPAGREGTTEDPSENMRMGRQLQGVRAALRRVESWARGVDGGDTGPFRTFLWNPISEAADRYRVAQTTYLQRYLEVIKPIEATLTKAKIAAPEIGHTFGNKSQLIHAILHTGNLSNKSKLLLGRNWGRRTEDGALDSSKWDGLVARMIADGTLTKADFDVIQAVWDLLEETKPGAQAAHRAIYGRYFAEVTADAFDTPWGTYRGGYVPALTDGYFVQDAVLRDEQRALEESDSAMFPAASNGFTKSRVEDYTRELALDLRLLPMHLDKVLKFTHLGPPVRDVARLLKGRALTQKMHAFDPVAQTDLLLPWLQRAATQQVQVPSKGQGGKLLDNFARALRSRVGMQLMFANVSNTVQQATGFSSLLARVDKARLRDGLWRYARDPKGTAEAVAGLSPFMASRTTGQMFEARQAIEQMLLDPSKYEKLRDFTQRHGYFMQSFAQNMVDTIGWAAAYDQAVQRGDNERDAIRFADSVVRETQGSMAAEDVSRFETGSAFTRLFTQFVGYFNTTANLNATEFQVVARGMGVPKGAGRLLYVYAVAFATPALLADLIAQAFRGELGDEDEDGYMDDFLAWFFGSQAKFAVAMVPGGGAALLAASGGFTEKPFDDKISLSPSVSVVESSARTPSQVYKTLVEGESFDRRDIRDTMTFLGVLTGTPLGALGRPIGYQAGVIQGDIQPTGPVDYARGLITGTPSPNSKVPG